MFWIYRATRGTNAPYIISGIIMIYLMWVVVRTLNMELLSNILGQFVSVGVIALIIVFQPEIRRFLQMIGMRQKRFNFIARYWRSVLLRNVLTALHMRSSYPLGLEAIGVVDGFECVRFAMLSGLRR